MNVSTFITVWQYADPERAETLFGSRLANDHDVVLFFLGDSFGFRVPSFLLDKLLRTAERDRGVILFPFFAWSIGQKRYRELEEIVPVLLNTHPDHVWLKASRLLAAGDLSFLADESFIENQATLFKVTRDHPVTQGLPAEFEIIHTYEFLFTKPGAGVLVEDSAGTPLVIQHPRSERIIYLNSCTHSCLSTAQVYSPLGSSPEYGALLRNVLARALALT